MGPKTLETRRYFDQYADDYLSNNYRIKGRSLIVRQLLGDVRHSSLLDLGCGDGSLSLQFLPGNNRLTLVDLSSQMLERAKSNTPEEHNRSVEYVNADLIDFEPENQYDIALCIGLLAHVESIDRTIAKLSQFLKPGGRCIIEVHDNDRLSAKLLYLYYSTRRSLSKSAAYAPNFNRTTLSEVIAIAASKNLKLASIRRHLLLLVGMGRLPSGWLWKYDLFVMSHPTLSGYASEAIALFEKMA